jgi:hypothetical protein
MQFQSGYNTPVGPPKAIGAAGLQSIPELMAQLNHLVQDPSLKFNQGA